jgi:hypothetical protein
VQVDIDWPADFGRWLDRIEEEARSADQRSRAILAFTARADPMIDQWKRETAYEEKP